MQYAPAAVKPRGESRANFDVAQELAQRMGLTDAVFRMSPHELTGELFKGAGEAFAPFEGRDLRESGPIKIVQPDAQVFKTPSGKLEIFSETLARQGIDPLPNWTVEEPELHGGRELPLRLLTAPGFFQSHTAFAGVSDLRRKEGAPFCVLNPEDAAHRNLTQGQRVRLFNSRGQVGLELRISDETLSGAVLVPGQREGADLLAGTVNMLCSDRFTDMGDGATYQSTWLEVEAWQ
jgi:anaerobic selenocysteine-containing dehydrogenase